MPQCRFVHHKQHMLPGCEHGPSGWEVSANRLNYGTAKDEPCSMLALFLIVYLQILYLQSTLDFSGIMSKFAPSRCI
jgi:hypothetical protein